MCVEVRYSRLLFCVFESNSPRHVRLINVTESNVQHRASCTVHWLARYAIIHYHIVVVLLFVELLVHVAYRTAVAHAVQSYVSFCSLVVRGWHNVVLHHGTVACSTGTAVGGLENFQHFLFFSTIGPPFGPLLYLEMMVTDASFVFAGEGSGYGLRYIPGESRVRHSTWYGATRHTVCH